MNEFEFPHLRSFGAVWHQDLDLEYLDVDFGTDEAAHYLMVEALVWGGDDAELLIDINQVLGLAGCEEAFCAAMDQASYVPRLNGCVTDWMQAFGQRLEAQIREAQSGVKRPHFTPATPV